MQKLNANKVPQTVGQRQRHTGRSCWCGSPSFFVRSRPCSGLYCYPVSDAVVAPTYLHLDLVQRSLDKSYKVAAQNCSQYGTGAYTAEIAAAQLKDAGIPWVILGHSERRQLFYTTDDVVAKQLSLALKNGLAVIACVGETLDERKSNHTWTVIEKQLNAIAGAVKADEWDKIVVAYEPVWAIGTGETASPQQAQEVHKQIREWAEKKVGRDVANKLRIIYGGSVKGSNADELFTQKDIDGSAADTATATATATTRDAHFPTSCGHRLLSFSLCCCACDVCHSFLVGGASLQAEDWNKIITSPTRIKSKL